MDISLTKDADKMLCEIYAVYMQRRKSDVPKAQAKSFYSQQLWPEKYAEKWNSPDGKETLRELRRAKLVVLDIVGGFGLQDEAIVYMESRVKSNVSEVAKWISEALALIGSL